ncbi:unnamed protein product, partial [Didymodactylos carnosus]
LQDYLKLCEDNKQIRTDTNYGLSELAETLFKSERYHEYVSYDEKTVVRPKVISMSCNSSDTTVHVFSTNQANHLKRKLLDDKAIPSPSSEPKKKIRQSRRTRI